MTKDNIKKKSRPLICIFYYWFNNSVYFCNTSVKHLLIPLLAVNLLSKEVTLLFKTQHNNVCWIIIMIFFFICTIMKDDNTIKQSLYQLTRLAWGCYMPDCLVFLYRFVGYDIFTWLIKLEHNMLDVFYTICKFRSLAYMVHPDQRWPKHEKA